MTTDGSALLLAQVTLEQARQIRALQADVERLQRRIEEYQAMEAGREWVHATAATGDYRLIGE